MAWSMPNTGPWNPAMGISPYSVKEWTDMQQHNWQEWAQWQQQYSQWHHQFGDKYSQQYPTMQQMGNMPILLPMNAVPPAPPPPDDPPPPPPHENDAPLFTQSQTKPSPVPPPLPREQRNSSKYGNSNSTPSSTQKWSTANKEHPPMANAEALKKLAEEERLFDIQFKKWEEEIDKWRKENIDHPDKEAYKEYEKKFETCRAQLMERRNQMKLKRAKLLGNSQSTNTSMLTNIVSTSGPQQQQENKIKYNSGSHAQNYQNSKTVPLQQRQQQPANKTNYNSGSDSQNYQNSKTKQLEQTSNSQYMKQQSNKFEITPNKPNNQNIDSQDRCDSYQHLDEKTSYSSYQHQQPAASFLPSSSSNKGIPGLDLVLQTDTPAQKKNQEIIDITGDNVNNLPQASQQQPDYSTISKGIHNILGDEKIMNILSMVYNSKVINLLSSYNNDNHNTPMSLQPFPTANQCSNLSGDPYPSNNHNDPHCTDDNFRNNYNNQQHRNRQMPNSSTHQNQDRYNPQNRMFNEGDVSQPEQQFDSYDHNAYGVDPRPILFENGQTRNIRTPLQSNVPPARPPFQEISGHHNIGNYSRDNLDRRNIQNNIDAERNEPVQPKWAEPPKPKWIEEPLFTPSIIVEYDHKPLRLKARDFIEPVHMFDYNHKSKNSESKKIDFEKEVEELFPKKTRWEREDESAFDEKFRVRDYDRRAPKENLKDDYIRAPPRVDFERRRPEDRYDDKKYDRGADDLDRFGRHDDFARERDYRDYRREDNREFSRDDKEFKREEEGRSGFKEDRDFKREDKYFRREDREFKWDEKGWKRDDAKDYRREDSRDLYRRDSNRNHSRSRERDSRKREHSYDSDFEDIPKIPKVTENVPDGTSFQPVVMIDDILESPGREMRPEKILIILRGPPGSGKSYLAKLIRDKEAENGGTARIMSIDDYFMQEGEVEEKDPVSGKIIKKPTLKYEYDAAMEEVYLTSLKKAVKRSLTDGYFSFVIYDAINENLRAYADIWNYGRQKGFQVYICTMDADAQTCFKRNVHKRTLEDIEAIYEKFSLLPAHHIQLDATTLLQNAAIPEVHMEDVKDDIDMVEIEEPEVENVFTSKWEKMDTSKLARLDGISKPLRPSQYSMEDYLQLDDWQPNKAKPGKKTVRWADIEERREQEKMRAIGFVVGQTDWNRMTDPTLGSSALTQTKYIERVRRN